MLFLKLHLFTANTTIAPKTKGKQSVSLNINTIQYTPSMYYIRTDTRKKKERMKNKAPSHRRLNKPYKRT